MTAKRSSDTTDANASTDLGALRSFVLRMGAEGKLDALADEIVRLVGHLCAVNEELLRKQAAASRKRPPSERSCRIDAEQAEQVLARARVPQNDNGSVPGNGDDTAPAPPPSRTRPKRGPKKPHQHGRTNLARLPRVREEHLIPEQARACTCCGTQTEHVRFRSRYMLDLIPAKVIVREIAREVVACPACRGDIRTAEGPAQVLDRGMLGTDLLVEAMVAHYGEAEPFERMARRAHEQNMPLCAVTLARGVSRLVDLLDPVVQHIDDEVCKATYKALDATSQRILDDEHPLGVRTGTLWLIEGDHRYARFHSVDKADSTTLAKLLANTNLAGASVMCDGSATINCADRAGAHRGGCHAHSRRKLVEALRLGDPRARRGIDIYAGIFRVDAIAKKFGESVEQRHRRRHEQTVPLIAELRAWVDEHRADVEPKCPLGKALGYLHRQWKRLTRFLEDPIMELTNNEVERDLRTHVLNRKTWLFCGNEQSAKRAAAALTVIITCRKIGVDPRAYVRDAVQRLIDGEKNIEMITPLAFARRARTRGHARADRRRRTRSRRMFPMPRRCRRSGGTRAR